MFTKKLFIIFIMVIAVMVAARYFKNKVGDVRPALLPAQKFKDVKVDHKQKGLPVEIPLKVAKGFEISVFAKDLGGPRDLQFSPGGTLLVSVPGRGIVVALPDKNKDGVADEAKNILTNLNKPHGLAFYGGKLFVAEETRLVRYTFDEATLTTQEDKILFDLPHGGRHVTRTIAFNKKGQMFVSIGSTCDVCFESDPRIGVIISDADGRSPHIFAKGLRNAVFIKVKPDTQELWGVEMGRDFLGDELPPDEVNILRDGGDYGWPVCYGARVYDVKFAKRSPSYCERTEAPIYQIAAHSAPLGLEFFEGDLLVSYHGSWNRSTPIGYKVVRLKVSGDRITGESDFITGFVDGSKALARPVDLELSKDGSLYLSDDKSGSIYTIAKK